MLKEIGVATGPLSFPYSPDLNPIEEACSKVNNLDLTQIYHTCNYQKFKYIIRSLRIEVMWSKRRDFYDPRIYVV